MGGMTATDLELLEEYAREGSEEAFAEIVRRHLDLIHSAALRQVRAPQLAEEVAQSAFAKLAQHAGQLKPETVVTAWLYQVTRHEAVDVIRREARRQLREQVATEMQAMNATDDWSRVEPLLDEAMQALEEGDRAAVLLRYFEGKSFREVGRALGTSDDTAQKRVSRAVERLRAFFTERGVPLAASGLTALITAQAVQAAPVGLGVAVVAASMTAGGLTTVGTTAVMAKTLVMTTTQKLAMAAAFAVLAGTGLYQKREVRRLREENQRLQAQTAPLAEQMREMDRALREASNRIATLSGENVRLGQRSTEVHQLRAANTQLRQDAGAASDPFVKQAMSWKETEASLRQLFAERPEQRVPELALLSDDQWLDVARGARLDSEEGIRKALSKARFVAKNSFAPRLSEALQGFVNANDGVLPNDLNQLLPYFKQPADPALLEQYKLVGTGRYEDLPPGTMPVTGQVLVDDMHDARWNIGPNGYGTQSSRFEANEASWNELKPTLEAFSAANQGRAPESYQELGPYATTTQQQAILKRLENEPFKQAGKVWDRDAGTP